MVHGMPRYEAGVGVTNVGDGDGVAAALGEVLTAIAWVVAPFDCE